jgi:hypothetical protein
LQQPRGCYILVSEDLGQLQQAKCSGPCITFQAGQACTKCERRGQYRKATLVERFGPDQNMVDLRADPGRRVPQNRRSQRGRRLRLASPSVVGRPMWSRKPEISSSRTFGTWVPALGST